MQAFWQDIRYGLRMLAKNPGFTFIAVLTLAFGIGANTAIFSLLNAVMLQSIPVHNPQQLFILRWSARSRPNSLGHSSFGDCKGTDWGKSFSSSCSFSYPMFQDVRERAGVFSGVGAFAGPAQLDLTGNGTASVVRGEVVSGDYFQTLGVPAAIGRTIEPADEKPGAEAVAVLSYAYWQGAFGGRADALGKSIKLNGVPFTIVGVADVGFTHLTPGKSQDMWLPLSQVSPLKLPWGGGPEKERTWWLVIVGRLKPGVAPAQAQASLSLTFRDGVVHNSFLKAEDEPKIQLLPAQEGLVGIRGSLGQPIYLLMAAVGILLLISCANVAGLMLSRATARQKEMAVRLALGAGRGRIIRQLLTESVMLAFAGAALGTLIAFWGANALAAFVAENRYSAVYLNADPDLTVLAFTVGVAVLTGILFGLAPAFRGTRVDVAPVLKENAGGISGASFAGGRITLGSVLVVAQVALSVVVLAGAGLVVRSLANLKSINPGFDTKNVLQFGINPKQAGYSKDEQVQPLYRELESRLSALPGVTSVSYSSDTLLDGGLWTSDFVIEGRADKSEVEVQMMAIGPEYLETMRIPLLAGRTLTPADQASTHDVALVNRAFVKRFLENRDPLGLHFGGSDAKDKHYEIVGVVGDTKYDTLRKDVEPTAFVPMKEKSAYFVVRTAGDPRALLPAIRQTVSGLDSNLPLFDVRTQTERIERLLFNERLLARLASLFGLLALALACVGLYGLLAYEVARRTREIGIRSSLGAQSRDVLLLVGSQGVALIVFGAVFGVVGAIGVTRSLGNLLFGVKPTDPITLLSVCALLTLVGAAACYIPARRATRVDPIVALRYE
ncbi:MAG TPA: ABC transporter permease [Candidatus Methylomirabilis sp.]|nr:ABC transporter permease [Candidatus Methylomirabilis sp.]